MTHVEIIGVYPVPEAEQPCHLIEVAVTDFFGELDIGAFTQPLASQDKTYWQVPFGEVVLEPGGSSGFEPTFPGPVQVNGNLRLAFFYYYLQPSQLLSQFGPLLLPPESSRPSRLSFIAYEPPC